MAGNLQFGMPLPASPSRVVKVSLAVAVPKTWEVDDVEVVWVAPSSTATDVTVTSTTTDVAP